MIKADFKATEKKDPETFEEYAARVGMSQESIDRGAAWNEHLKQRQHTPEPT